MAQPRTKAELDSIQDKFYARDIARQEATQSVRRKLFSSKYTRDCKANTMHILFNDLHGLSVESLIILDAVIPKEE